MSNIIQLFPSPKPAIILLPFKEGEEIPAGGLQALDWPNNGIVFASPEILLLKKTELNQELLDYLQGLED